MIKFSRVDDVYFFDETMSIPGVRDGYIQRAAEGDPDFVTIKDEDGFEGVFLKGDDGRLIGVGPAIQLAAGPATTATDATEEKPLRIDIVGVGQPTPPEEVAGEQPSALDEFLAQGGMTLPADAETMSPAQMGKIVVDGMAGIARGGVKSTLGFGGDVEQLFEFIGRFATDRQGGGFMDRISRAAAAFESPTLLPTSEDIERSKILPPVIPSGVTTDRAMREKAAAGGELAGGLVADPFLAAKGIRAGVGAVKSMAQDVMTTAPVGAINIAAFNPKQEIKTAIDLVAKNPETSIYVPQANRAPSVALSITKPEIIGTGNKGIIVVSDAGKVLEQTQIAFNGGKVLDPTNPQDLKRMIDSASAEAEFQLSQPISGATWYEDDVATAFKLSSKIVSELATDEPLRVLTTAFAASTSYNTRAGANWGIATRIADHLVKTGTVAARNPDNGKLWGGTTGPIMEQQLKLHEYMIKKMGLDGYASWLLTPHTVKEITQMKMESGLYKSATTPGKATDMKMGAFIMGEKGGPFFLNLNGIKETTADKWFTRTFNRHTGTLTSGPVSEQGLVDAPRNEAERLIMKTWNRAVAQNVKLDEQANQAVLWYFEQNLYYNLGVKSARSESFSDGAKNLLNARGIAIDESTGAAAASSGNAGKVRAKQASSTAAGNSVGSGSPAADANTTNVARGRAPAKGAK